MPNLNSHPQTVESDRLERLKRVQAAFEVVEKGEQLPELEPRNLAKPRRSDVAAKAVEIASIAQESIKPLGPIVSQSMPPPAFSNKSGVGSNLLVKPSGSAFERLKTGQARMGRNVERIKVAHPGMAHLPEKEPVTPEKNKSEPTSLSGQKLGSVPIKALSKEVIDAIERETRLKMVVGFLEVVGNYYKTSREELELEIKRLDKLSPLELSKATMAYEFATHQVLTVTNEEHARKTARESNANLRDFYETNSVTEIQLANERQEFPNRVEPQKKKNRKLKA